MQNRLPALKQGIQQTKVRSANYQITGAESGTAYTNAGTANVTLTLPHATVGQEYWFYSSTVHTFTIAAMSSDIIGSKTAGSSYATTTKGLVFWVKCFVAGAWTIAINSGFT